MSTPMSHDEMVAALREGVTASSISAREASRRATGSADSIKRIFRGHKPSAERLARICHEVGLEFYLGPPRRREYLERPALPSDTESHQWGDRRGKEVTPYPVPMHEGHRPERVGFSPNGCAHFGLDFLLSFDLNPKLCEVVEIHDDSMAPEFPSGAAGLVDLRRTKRRHGCVYALGIPELTVRRAEKRRGEWVVAADNPKFESVPWRNDFVIVGVVVWTSHMVGKMEMVGP